MIYFDDILPTKPARRWLGLPNPTMAAQVGQLERDWLRRGLVPDGNGTWYGQDYQGKYPFVRYDLLRSG